MKKKPNLALMLGLAVASAFLIAPVIAKMHSDRLFKAAPPKPTV